MAAPVWISGPGSNVIAKKAWQENTVRNVSKLFLSHCKLQ
jgi:hypothetical protein